MAESQGVVPRGRRTFVFSADDLHLLRRESARDFRSAIATQRQLLSTYPDSQKVPDALLNIASCQADIGEAAPAKRTLEEIISRYPTSEAAGKARQRLAKR